MGAAMLFADNKGVWDVISEQAPGVSALLIAFAMILFFLWKIVIRYGDQLGVFLRGLMAHLNETSNKVDSLVKSNECLPALADSVQEMAGKVKAVADKLEDWPSDAPECKADGGCHASSLEPHITGITDEIRKLAAGLSDAEIIDVMARKRAQMARKKTTMIGDGNGE